MSRIGKFTVSAALLLPLALGGCKPTKGTANPEDYFPLIQVALAGGETASMIGRNESIRAKNFGGCVASASLVTAFDAGNQILAGRLSDQIVVPAVEIDVSECLALRESSGEESASVVLFETRVAGYVAPAEGEEAPAEEATEEAAAEEAPAEETAPEETPEEPTAEEEEAPAALQGHPDAAALVEAIAGITLTAVLHYANKLKGANCKKGTAALGAVNYINGMIKPIADEIAEPDGKVSVPSVVIDLSECSDG